ncbi:MAG: hypothetical protein H0X64_08645 [Gemmatimonadaceae bacterium]|nr:hypothetical protein [Gemmatimonadaceae bacterium]
MTVLGAGGAARAVLTAAEARGSERVDVIARDAMRGAYLAAEFAVARAVTGAPPPDTELVVNATPVGLRDDAHPLSPDLVPRGAAVLDLTYRPGGTPWVNACRSTGHIAADGTEMLLAQGALAFERFTGRSADLDVMRAALAGR